MKRKLLCFFLAPLAIYLSCGVALAGTQDKTLLAEVPFVVESGLVIVQVKINGLGPYNMALATGRDRSLFSHDAATALHLRMYSNPGPITDLADPPKLVTLPTMEIGPMKLGNIDLDLGKGFESRSSQTLYGMLGGDFLKDRIVQIDYPNSVVRFYSASPYPKEQPADSKRVMLPMRFELNLTVPILDGVSINDKKIKIVLDSAFPGILSLTPTAVKYLGLESEVAALPVSSGKNKNDPRKGQVKTLMVGTLKLDSPSTLFYMKGSSFDQKIDKFGGIVGNSFMQDYKVTFDYRNKMVTFE
jgi:hypothetical protein